MSYAKINMRSAVYGKDAGGNSLNETHIFFQEHLKEFTYLFDTDTSLTEVQQGASESDKGDGKDRSSTENELENIYDHIGDSISILVGETGSGKTEGLSRIFQFATNSPAVIKDHNSVVIPDTYHAQQPDIVYNMEDIPRDPQEQVGETYSPEYEKRGTSRDIAKAMSATCELLEMSFPVLGKADGKDDKLWDLIFETNLKAAQLIPKENKASQSARLEYMEENTPFVFYASKLKLYLSDTDCDVNRLIIILDGVDTMDDNERDAVISSHLKFYHCMRNRGRLKGRKMFYVNLVVSMWPSTYQDLYSKKWFSPYRSSKIIYQENIGDLDKYFGRKLAMIPPEYSNKEGYRWKDVEQVTKELCTKYDKKFSKMIMGLSNNSTREALNMCHNILSDPVWMTRYPDRPADPRSYFMNNISILRAIGCGRDRVYNGHGNKTIPNILYNRMAKDGRYLEDNSMISLYIIKYLIQKNTVSARAWPARVTRGKVVTAIVDTFGDEVDGIPEFKTRVENTLTSLCKDGIINEGNGPLYLSAKGNTLYDCLSSDSVLCEMYREDFLQETDGENAEYRFVSSMDFLSNYDNGQVLSFAESYRFVRSVFNNTERKLILAAKARKSWPRYISLFGEHPMVWHLSEGIRMSVEFAGKANDPTISEAREALFHDIDSVWNSPEETD